jgi:hypothetical protein
MTTLWQAPAIVIVITWLSAPPGTLGNAARQEALRRSLMPRSVIALSLYDWPPAVVGSESVGSTPPAARSAPDPAAAATPPASPAGAIPPAASSEPARDEAWWRTRIATARASLARDQTMAEAMQSHVNALQNDVVNRDDPAQQALLRQRLATALAELERLKDQIAADRKTILDIQDEARRLGVPAGWIRDEPISSGRSP